jgi:hypothetical protein
MMDFFALLMSLVGAIQGGPTADDGGGGPPGGGGPKTPSLPNP